MHQSMRDKKGKNVYLKSMRQQKLKDVITTLNKTTLIQNLFHEEWFEYLNWNNSYKI